jgi:hypothetical protein
MRQSDGTDLLGASDPRGASIGIIRVDPTDARQDVLTAILAQEELKRTKIAVVLHEQNRAFQRPVDFDGLKDMRRSLKAKVVIVARDGRGPAEFARQRRFEVYSSLENFASSVLAETPVREGKRGWFGRKQKTAPLASPGAGEKLAAPVMDAVDTRQPLQFPGPAANGVSPAAAPAAQARGETRAGDDEDDVPTLVTDSSGAGAMGVIGAVGATALGASLLDQDDELLAPPPSSRPAASGAASPYSSITADREQSSGIVKPSPPAPRAADAGPGIITLPSSKQRPRSTLKLPAAAPEGAGAGAATAAPASARQGNTGKQRAALAGTGIAAGAGAAAFAAAPPPAGASGAPPGSTSVGAPVGGGGGGRQRRRSRSLLALLLVLLTVLLLAGIAFASPVGQQILPHILPGSTTTATVTITPDSSTVADNFVITAVTGTPVAASRQVQARIISVTSASQSASANATGAIPGKQASGVLVFINGVSNGPVTIQGGTLKGKSGVAIAFSGPVTIPVGSKNVTGVAVNVGVGGNIPAFDISGPCCGSGIVVKNPSAFSGGVNAQPNKVITQNDINGATNNLIALVKPAAQNQLKGMVNANEEIVPSSLNCTASVSANHKVNDIAPTVTVTGTATCSEEVYDKTGAQKLASDALKAEAATNPGAGYAPVDTILTSVMQVTVIDSKHTVSVLVHAVGVWAYQFSTTLKAQLASAIANKNKSSALTYLKAVTGVRDVTIAISSGDTLPQCSTAQCPEITITIKSVAGPSGGTPMATPTSPAQLTPGSSPVATPIPSITPQNGQGGS